MRIARRLVLCMTLVWAIACIKIAYAGPATPVPPAIATDAGDQAFRGVISDIGFWLNSVPWYW